MERKLGLGRDVHPLSPSEIARHERNAAVSALEDACILLGDVPPDEPWKKELMTIKPWLNFDGGIDTIHSTIEDPETGNTYEIEEGLPVENLLGYLNSLKEDLIDGDDLPTRLKLSEIITLIEQSSVTFESVHRRNFSDKVFEQFLRAVIHQEARQIRNDERDTNDDKKNFQLATEIIENRREFRPPILQSTEETGKKLISANLGIKTVSQQFTPDKQRIKAYESLLIATSTGVPVAAAIQELGEKAENPAMFIGTVTSIAAIKLVESYRKKRSNSPPPKASSFEGKKQSIEQLVKVGVIPIAGNTIGPHAALEVLNSLPPEVTGVVKGGVLVLYAGRGKKVISILKAPIKDFAEEKMKSSIPKLSEQTYNPFINGEDDGPTTTARKRIRDSIDFLHDIHVISNILPNTFQTRIIDSEKIKDIENQLIGLNAAIFTPQQLQREVQAFIYYEHLSEFLVFLDTYKHSFKGQYKSLAHVASDAIINNLYKLDPIALSAIDDIKKTFQLSDEEYIEFQNARALSAGMSFLLKLQAERDTDSKEWENTEQNINSIYERGFGSVYLTPEEEIEVDKRKKLLNRVSFADYVTSKVRDGLGEGASGITETIFHYGLKIPRRPRSTAKLKKNLQD